MSIQTFKGGFPFPAWPTAPAGAPTLGNAAVAVSQKAAIVLRSTVAKSIRKIRFRTGTVTTGGTLDLRIESVDLTTGDPSGNLIAANTNIAHVLGSGDDDAWITSAALTADASLSIGTLYAIVIVADASAAFNINIYSDVSNLFPFNDLTTAGTYAKATSSNYLIIPEYSDGSFEPNFGFFGSGAPINANSFNSGTATNRRGNIFQLPFPCQTNGCWVWVDADGDFTINLYDSNGTSVLATTGTIDKDVRGGAGPLPAFYPFTASANLLANTNYRLVIIPDTVTSIIAYDFDIPTAGMMDMFPGGQACHRSVFTSSAWVETTTSRSYIGLFLNGFDDAVSSGGGLRLAGSGGLAAGA